VIKLSHHTLFLTTPMCDEVMPYYIDLSSLSHNAIALIIVRCKTRPGGRRAGGIDCFDNVRGI
jgi:hypothetical protein